MDKLGVTAIILAKNEDNFLPACLESISWVDEMVIVGDEPTEEVLNISKQAEAKIYRRKLDNFCNQRNFALTKVKTPWVLLIDPDEQMTPELAGEMQEAVKNGGFDAYRFPRKNIIFGKWIEHTGWYPDWQTHLFKTAKGKYVGKIHEQVEINGTVGDLKSVLLHNNYQSVSQYLEKNFKYTSLEAERQLDSGYQFAWRDLIQKPSSEFLRRFFVEEGYKDGIHGLTLSLLQSFMELLVYIKIWENRGFPAEETPEVFDQFDKSMKDVDYWVALKTKNPLRKILHKLR